MTLRVTPRDENGVRSRRRSVRRRLVSGTHESAQSVKGVEVPLIDGGAFAWVARLTSNRRAVYAASGLGSQLVPLLFRPARQE
jgi:hypothetical protein